MADISKNLNFSRKSTNLIQNFKIIIIKLIFKYTTYFDSNFLFKMFNLRTYEKKMGTNQMLLDKKNSYMDKIERKNSTSF